MGLALVEQSKIITLFSGFEELYIINLCLCNNFNGELVQYVEKYLKSYLLTKEISKFEDRVKDDLSNIFNIKMNAVEKSMNKRKDKILSIENTTSIDLM